MKRSALWLTLSLMAGGCWSAKDEAKYVALRNACVRAGGKLVDTWPRPLDWRTNWRCYLNDSLVVVKVEAEKR